MNSVSLFLKNKNAPQKLFLRNWKEMIERERMYELNKEKCFKSDESTNVKLQKFIFEMREQVYALFQTIFCTCIPVYSQQNTRAYTVTPPLHRFHCWNAKPFPKGNAIPILVHQFPLREYICRELVTYVVYCKNKFVNERGGFKKDISILFDFLSYHKVSFSVTRGTGKRKKRKNYDVRIFKK